MGSAVILALQAKFSVPLLAEVQVLWLLYVEGGVSVRWEAKNARLQGVTLLPPPFAFRLTVSYPALSCLLPARFFSPGGSRCACCNSCIRSAWWCSSPTSLSKHSTQRRRWTAKPCNQQRKGNPAPLFWAMLPFLTGMTNEKQCHRHSFGFFDEIVPLTQRL